MSLNIESAINLFLIPIFHARGLKWSPRAGFNSELTRSVACYLRGDAEGLLSPEERTMIDNMVEYLRADMTDIGF